MPRKSKARSEMEAAGRGDTGVTTPPVVKRFNTLLVVRESAESDRILFEDMIVKTVQHHRRFIPELEQLIEAGLEPLNHPEKWGGEGGSESKTHWSVFSIGSTLIYYCMGSATRIDEGTDTNFFNEKLCELIEIARPNEIRVFWSNRLVRAPTVGADLTKVLIKYGIHIEASDVSIDMSKSPGQTQWSMLVSYAAAERDGIVERNRLGVVAAARRNRWTLGRRVVPFGYRYDEDEKTIRPIEEDRERIALALSLLADPDVSDRELLERLAETGLTRESLRKRDGDAASIRSLEQGGSIRRSFETYLHLYETGRHRMALLCPTRGVDLFGGLPVYGATDSSPGHVILTPEYGRPERGWTDDPTVFQRIRDRKAERVANYTSPTGRRRHLSGRKFEHDGVHYALNAASSGYQLVRLEHSSIDDNSDDPEFNFDMEGPVVSQSVISNVDLVELHESVAHGVVGTLESSFGADGTLKTRHVSLVDDDARVLEAHIEHYERLALNARNHASASQTAATAEGFIADAEGHQAMADEARRELAARETSPAPLPRSIRADVGPLLNGLELLRTGTRTPDEGLAKALRQIMPVFKIYPSSKTGRLKWQATIRVPTEDGAVLEFTGITGEVDKRSYSPHKVVPARDDDTLEMFAGGATVTEIAEHFGDERYWTAQRIRGLLHQRGLPDHVINRTYRAPIPELRQLIGALALGGLFDDLLKKQNSPAAVLKLLERNSAVPRGSEPAWAAHTASRYTIPAPDRGVGWLLPVSNGQRVLDLISGSGGQISLADLRQTLGKDASSPAFSTGRLLLGKGGVPPIVKAVAPWRTDGRGAHSTNVITLIPCKQCGRLVDLHLRVCEIPGTLLCAACRQLPYGKRIVFPESYLTVPRGVDHVEERVERVKGGERTSTS